MRLALALVDKFEASHFADPRMGSCYNQTSINTVLLISALYLSKRI